MFDVLWLIPAVPLAGFVLLALGGSRLAGRTAGIVGTVCVGLSALIALLAAVALMGRPPAQRVVVQTLWTWFKVSGLAPGVALYLDTLSLTMMLVVTGVGFLIHLYSIEFMQGEEGYARFFAYMNLFVAAMLILVLADDLLLFYLGWEGVGLCSYLLIGFWYTDPENGYAARKAFVVTRVGDTALAIGLFLLFTQLGTLQIQELADRAARTWTGGSLMPTIAALLLLGGAVGKSAQLPLQTWLPDAMAGPSPVSALIHAATMVTAGVYLIARTHALFTLAPAVMTVVAVIGAATLLLAAFSALAQRDIKRLLAYSTISQIGYMFLGLGVGAWTAAMFHFMIHAFFKALLFLGAGAVILSLDHEHDIFRMGGLRTRLPVTFWTFLAGAAALSAFPLVTAGFYSKDLIIWQSYAGVHGHIGFWIAALSGAFLTAVYTFRMVFLVFFNEPQQEVSQQPGSLIQLPLMLLAVLSLIAGFLEPEALGLGAYFSDFLHSALPHTLLDPAKEAHKLIVSGLGLLVAPLGILVIYLLHFHWKRGLAELSHRPAALALHRLWRSGWGFDRLYDATVVHPYVRLAQINRMDAIDQVTGWIAGLHRVFYRSLSRTQTGKVRGYALGIALGGAIVIGVAVLL